jgi:hypothetical protein
MPSTLVLGPLFLTPLHRLEEPGRIPGHYYVTNKFDGPDLVNIGGRHNATDVGNFGLNDPVVAPFTGRCRGKRHFDTSLGIEFDLGGGWSLELWHLNETQRVDVVAGASTVGPWIPCSRNDRVGITGKTGPPLANGSPMPAHTHIALILAGVLVDAEPYLFGRPVPIGGPEEDDMRTPKNLKHLVQVTVAVGSNLRREPSTSADALPVDSGPARMALHGFVTGGAWTIGTQSGTEWAVVSTHKGEVLFVAAPLASGPQLTNAGKRLLPTG